jgi:hypothetical protein
LAVFEPSTEILSAQRKSLAQIYAAASFLSCFNELSAA